MAYTPPSSKKFLAMAGNIGCGKTTAAKMLSQTFGLELFDEPVIDNRFLADYYRDMPRWSFTLQLEFLIKRVQHHDLISRVPKSCIQDRTLYEDPEIFAKYLNGLGYMDARELELYYDYFAKMHEGLHRPDKVICLVVQNVDVLLQRIRTRAIRARTFQLHFAVPNAAVAQASCLWGDRASRLVDVLSAGKMPAGPTAKMAVLPRQAFVCLANDLIHNSLRVLCAFPHHQLPVCACPFAHNSLDVRDLALIAELLRFFGDKSEHLFEQLALVRFAFATEIDQLAV